MVILIINVVVWCYDGSSFVLVVDFFNVFFRLVGSLWEIRADFFYLCVSLIQLLFCLFIHSCIYSFPLCWHLSQMLFSDSESWLFVQSRDFTISLMTIESETKKKEKKKTIEFIQKKLKCWPQTETSEGNTTKQKNKTASNKQTIEQIKPPTRTHKKVLPKVCRVQSQDSSDRSKSISLLPHPRASSHQETKVQEREKWK